MLSSSRVAFATKNTPSLNVPQGLKPPSGGPVSSPVSMPMVLIILILKLNLLGFDLLVYCIKFTNVGFM